MVNPEKNLSFETTKIAAALFDAAKAEKNEIFLTDLNGVLLFSNAVAEKNFPNLKVGTPVFTFLRAPLLKKTFDNVRDGAVETAETRFIIRGTIERNMHAELIRIQEEKESFIHIRLHDETEQVKAATAQRDFVANVSHELRTPLASIAGFVETLRGPAKEDEEAREKFLEIMAAQADRMNALIQSLLSLSRLELNQHTAPTTKLRLKAIVTDAATALAPLAEKKQITVKTALSFAETEEILGDKDELFRVFQNLIENAIKYSPEETQVTVIGEKIDKNLVITVRDQGFGIAPEHLPRLTERFYRVDEARNRAVGGAGLGLSIVHRIILRHKGKLDIESEVGKGSDFKVSLPL